MRIHILQHVAFEGPAIISNWYQEQKFPVTLTRFFQGDALPKLDQFELLIILGGPMGVADTLAYPWLKDELSFIRDCINEHKAILGICLGAQLIAHSLGAQITPNAEKEIGWFNVQRHTALKQHPLAAIIPAQFNAFHWHGETFSLPDKAIPLASSVACSHQGFVYNDRVIALQFHLETTIKSVQQLINHCRDELTNSFFIQTETEILAHPEYFTQAQQHMNALLEYLFAQSNSDDHV